jgi:hypothetical protein
MRGIQQFQLPRETRIRDEVKKNTPRFMPLFHIAVVCLVWLDISFTLPPSKHTQQVSRELPGKALSEARFLYADLDGDQKPDLALVETESQHSAKNNYSIRLKLSHGVESAIGVNGPIGGLRVVARDVNGDDHVDLIVTANLDGEFIEVLLNDGRGNFSVAPPGEFAGLKNENESRLGALTVPRADLVTLASLRSPHEQGPIQSCDLVQAFTSDSRDWVDDCPAVQHLVLSRQSRSPPPQFALS